MDGSPVTKRRMAPASGVRFPDAHYPTAMIFSLPQSHYEWDGAALASSFSHVEGWIQAEVHRGADPRRIILMGFSQGAALDLLVALMTLHDLGGVVSLAGWIPHKGREVSHHQTMPMR